MMNPFTGRIHLRPAMWTCLLAASVLSSLAGCSSGTKTSPAMHTASIDGAQAHETAWVAKGQTLTVKLPTQGGASYSWRLAPSSADNDLLSLEQRCEQQSMSGGGLASPGEPACDVFVFRARHTGQTSLEFICDYAWSPDSSTSKQMVLNVDVTNPSKSTAVAVGQ